MTHCCEVMARAIDPKCPDHPDPWDCADALIAYWPRFDCYGMMIKDGGRSVLAMDFCPWCGHKLRDLTDIYFETLEQLGIDYDNDTLPKEFANNAWWKARSL